MSEKDISNLAAILDSCAKIRKFVADYWDADALFADDKSFDAVLMNFVIIGEAVARLSNACKENSPHITWDRIKGFRNMVAHDYFGVDAEEVWQIINNHLPGLANGVEEMLKKKN